MVVKVSTELGERRTGSSGDSDHGHSWMTLACHVPLSGPISLAVQRGGWPRLALESVSKCCTQQGATDILSGIILH